MAIPGFKNICLLQAKAALGSVRFQTKGLNFEQTRRSASSRSEGQDTAASGQTQQPENPVTDIISALIRPQGGSKAQRNSGALGRDITSIQEQSQSPGNTNSSGLSSFTMANGSSRSPQGYMQKPFVRPPPPLRLNPYVGREIEVAQQRGVSVSRALRQMELLCALNKVRSDYHRLRFHERPGLARKRLRRERWRRIFKDGFRDTVKQIHEMRKRGW